ncbi:stalk domain-containing protein [Paenibacillus guangzhouensis]|uniref:stalk domain-containing protein n=1 Tax=Paenibacillus guangzhouensis TaxID=1473112 RepID=UPI001266A8AF|nr:stalk domain-containing protein [Paenibacillus guangzhouensis]
MNKQFIKTTATLFIGMMLGTVTIAAAAPEVFQASIAKLKIVVNGKEQKLKNSPLLVNGTTYLPVRDVAGLLGANVDFNKGTITIAQKKVQPTVNTIESINGRDLVEILGKKYPDFKISLSNEGLLKLGDNIIHLTVNDDSTLNVTPLKDSGFISKSDL